MREFVIKAVERWPLAICSGALRVEITTILEAIGLLEYFKFIVSSDDIAASKPDPAGFLHTLSLLRRILPDLAAEQCLAIEDSVHGVKAAKSAGMPVLVVGGRSGAEALSLADMTAADMRSVTQTMLAAL